VDLAVDLLITAIIISFLTSWIVAGTAQNKIAQGDIAPRDIHYARRKMNPSLIGFLISLGVTLVLGGLLVDGAIFLAAPDGMTGLAYATVKTLFTALTGAVSAIIGVMIPVWGRTRTKR
jgi:hypothetical protein